MLEHILFIFCLFRAFLGMWMIFDFFAWTILQISTFIILFTISRSVILNHQSSPAIIFDQTQTLIRWEKFGFLWFVRRWPIWLSKMPDTFLATFFPHEITTDKSPRGQTWPNSLCTYVSASWIKSAVHVL